jgi:hypothetical protein
MTKSNDEIGKALDVNIEPYQRNKENAIAVIESATTEEDFDIARSNLLELIADGKDVLDSLIAVAQTSDNARTFEVAGNFIKMLAEVNRELIDVAVKKKAIVGAPTTPGKTVNNNLFVGSTSELLAFMKKNSIDVSNK